MRYFLFQINSSKRQIEKEEVIDNKRMKIEEQNAEEVTENVVKNVEKPRANTEIIKVILGENEEITLEAQQTDEKSENQIIIETEADNTSLENETIQEIQIEEIIEQSDIPDENYEKIQVVTESDEANLIFEDPTEEIVTSTPKVAPVKTHCFACNYCERSFPLQQLLDIHMRQHTKERKFTCSECGKKFFTKHDLMKHSHTHTGAKPFVCVVCEKAFSRATLLHRHEKIHVAVPKYLCTYCDRTFLTSEDLDTHMKDHKKNRPFQCQKCDKKFAFKQGLERHEISHTNEDAFKCDYCPETFSTSLKLQRHITRHAGSRPFPCKMCPRTFVLSHHLTRHMKSHYAQKNKEEEGGEYKCDVCSMSFKRKFLLINHSAIHSMVNLKCVICNKEFEDAETVKEHIKTHLGSTPYVCFRCEYSFENEDDLLEHEDKHYDNDNTEDDTDAKEDTNMSEEIKTSDTPRRSQREKKVKNYVDFLKVEDMSDSDDNYVDDNSNDEDFIKNVPIPPVVRSEAVKVYKGKDKLATKLQQIVQETEQTEKNILTKKSPSRITTLDSLGISQSALDAMTDKSGFVEMKIGQKIIRVQKLMMSKAEVQAMSERSKLNIKSGKVIVKNSPDGIDLNKLVQAVNEIPVEENMSSHSSKNVRTYEKKIITKKDDEAIVEMETVKDNSNNENDSPSIAEKIQIAIDKVQDSNN